MLRLGAEEAESAEGEIDRHPNHNQGDNPVAQLVEQRQPGADEHLDKVVGRPRHKRREAKPRGTRKLCLRTRYKRIHITNVIGL